MFDVLRSFSERYLLDIHRRQCDNVGKLKKKDKKKTEEEQETAEVLGKETLNFE